MDPTRDLVSVVVACVVFVTGMALAGVPPKDVQARISDLRKGVRSAKTIERRRAARGLLTMGEAATAAILELAQSEDVVIKRAALRRIHELLGAGALAVLTKALDDPDPLVRVVAVEQLLALEPRGEEVKQALMRATRDGDTAVRKTAAGAFWTFHRDVVPLRKRPGWDHAIEVITRLPLPKTGWKFRADPGRDGHVRKWFDPGLDEADWLDIVTEVFWHDALPEKVGRYLGIGWYRTTVSLPAKPEGTINTAVLRFEAVDESTWLWVNGEYAGGHDIGPEGWTTTFDIDITPFVKWGSPNQMTVRVLNTAGAGGIYKPVEFQVLR